MFENFNEFSFNVIDVVPRGMADMLISKNGLTVSRGAVDEMGYPAYVRMLVDAENKVFAIQTCKIGDENAVRFSSPKAEQTKPVYCMVRNIRSIVFGIMADQWKEEESYRIKGVYFKESNAMVFNLKSAVLRSKK